MDKRKQQKKASPKSAGKDVTAKAKRKPGELSEEQLDKVAGGAYSFLAKKSA